MSTIIEFFTDWRAVLQIVLLFSMIYLAMYHLRNTHGSLVMAGLLMFIGSLWCLAQALDLDVISRLKKMPGFPDSPVEPNPVTDKGRFVADRNIFSRRNSLSRRMIVYQYRSCGVVVKRK